MFIRTKHDPKVNRTRVQIVKSVRTGKKVRQKILLHVGVAHNDSEVESIKRLAGQLMEQLRADQTPQMEFLTPTEYVGLQNLAREAPRPENLNVDLGDCREETRLSLGFRNVMGTVYDQLGWNSLLGARRKSANRIVRELVLARLSQPESMHATVKALANQAGITFNLDSVYRSMDYLDTPVIKRLCRKSHEAAEKLLDGPVNVLFYDCTTLAFDTECEDDQANEKRDHLLAKGFSKDGQHHRSQVILALMVTSEGLPVGYELFPGNTWADHTLEVALQALEKRFDITRIMVVADGTLLSNDNQAMLSAKGVSHILDYRMKSAPAALKARFLDKVGAQPWSGHGTDDISEEGWYKVIEHEKSRIIVTYSPTRARKDAHKHDKAIEKLQRKLNRSRKPSNFSSRGSGHFLSFSDNGDVAIDEARIKEAANWDGLHAILVHGADDLDAQDVIARYHQISKIEACFRTNVHDLKTRPIFHWTPQKVRAHIAICYMAFCCLQHLCKRLDMLGHPMSPARIRKELNALQVSILRRKGTGERYAMPSPVTTDAKRILTCVGLTWNEAPFQMPPERTRKTSQTES